MKLRMYSVFDKKVEAYMPPVYFRSEGEAKRSFVDALQNNQQFIAHRSDYSFAFIGLFDDNLGSVEPNVAPIHVMDGATATSADVNEVLGVPKQ